MLCLVCLKKGVSVWHTEVNIVLGSWNGNGGQTQPQQLPVTTDDDFTDPAIVSGCLSSTNSNDSPPSAQPHWLRSIQQLTEIESSPVKHASQPAHPMPPVPSMYTRQPATHSRMSFAQNTQLNQPGNDEHRFSANGTFNGMNITRIQWN